MKRAFSWMPARVACPAVPVGDLVAEAGPHPGLIYRRGDLVQAAGDVALAGVVVDEGGGAVADGIHQADQGAVVHVVGPQGLVQPPPQLFQDLGKVGGWLAREGHAPGKGAVEVGVGADEAGQHQAAAGIQALGAGVAGLQLGAGPEVGDALILDVQGTVGNDLVGRPHGDQCAVGD